MKKQHGFYATLFIVLTTLVFFIGCEQGGPGDEGELDVDIASTVSCDKDTGDVLDLNCPELPDPIFSTTPDYDIFAWNSFVAANWPALDPGSYNEQRGFPDTTKTFAQSDPLRVWETWKEKREIFIFPVGTTTDPGPWNSEVNYHNSFDDISLCGSGDPVPPGARLFGGSSKVNSLDEVKEVPSEALESSDQLCGQASGYCADSANANEACCYVKHLAVEPLVWKGQPDTTDTGKNLVRFEVKLNYDYYDYVTDPTRKYYIQANAEAAATGSTPITLPYRTSAATTSGPSGDGKVVDYSASTCLSNLSNVTTTSDENPCPVGSIQTKAAWVPLTPTEVSSNEYLTTTAYQYEAVPVSSTFPKGICVDSTSYGLIGLHIIQRFHPTNGNATGGAYLFASWEHKTDSSGVYYYSNYLAEADTVNGIAVPAGYYPPLDSPNGALLVERSTDRYGVDLSILSSTQIANATVHDSLDCPDGSVWCNYYLVGTQYAGFNGSTNPSTPAADTLNNDVSTPSQTYYLANLVVETNYGLQKFIGTPPGKTFIDRWGLGGSTGTTFDRSAHNLAFGTGSSAPRNASYNMGGCMGCHGVVQQLGYSFSFVLKKNQGGSEPETPPPSQ